MQPPPGATRSDPPRFAVDHMLLKLGKYLRILGLDAEWQPGTRTHELIARANAEGRAFLTRNTRIEDQYPRPDRMLRIESTDPVQQLRQVVEALDLDPRARLFTRCIRCNLELVELGELGADAARVPERVRERYDRFWRCPGCATIFWRGTHVDNTLRKLGLCD